MLTFLDKSLEKKKCMAKSFPFVTIAIPALNEEETIRKTLESAISLKYPRNKMEIIVINDGSKDNTERIISENKKTKIMLITNSTNKGKGASLNEALRLAKGKFFTCLDADSFIEPDALIKMIPYFDDPTVGAVLPLMKVKDPKTFLEKMQWCEYVLNLFYKSIMSRVNCIHVAPGPFSVYRKNLLLALGGFAENNITEDLEISLRLQKNHYRILQLLNVNVYTKVPNTIKGVYKQRNRWYKGTMLNLFSYKNLLLNKRYGDFGIVQLPHVFISGFLAAVSLLLISYTMVVKPLFRWLYEMSFVNFDFIYFFKNWATHFLDNFSVLNYNITNIFFALTAISVSVVALYFAYKLTNEKVFKHGLFAVPGYMFLYGLLVSMIWIGVFFELLLGKVQKW